MRRMNLVVGGAGAAVAVSLAAALIDPPVPFPDFHLSGTQVGDVNPDNIWHSGDCTFCHSDFDPQHDPYATWSGSLMGLAGRDPLFYAQMTNANQDVPDVGYFCLRCHVPNSFVTGHAYDTDGSTLDEKDRDGVSCHFCHAMVDPIYKPGISPARDEDILNNLAEVPQFYGNAMYVLDPQGHRRGPRVDAQPMHEFVESPFHKTGEFCGTCHDVGNVAVTRQSDGTYLYNTPGQPTPTEDLWEQFPLERTYTEWKLSAFAGGGVDMGGRFGGTGGPVVSTCQDCHMPKANVPACAFHDPHPDTAVHDFAGAAAQVLDLIAAYTADDPSVDQGAIAAGRAKAVSMLQRSADIELEQHNGSLRVRVINQTGHKLPTGHIEGRTVWVNVRFYDINDHLLREYGAYDMEEAHLDAASTEVYEMHVGLSEYAASLTGLPAGQTGHMALADMIVKDNRIPPRGFDNAAFGSAGAPVVGTTTYTDGQYWDDSYFAVPDDAFRAEARVYYQCLPRHYMEELRDGNHTDHWGQTLYDLWVETGKGVPIRIDFEPLDLALFVPGDLTGDGAVNVLDVIELVTAWGQIDAPQDLNGDRTVDLLDLLELIRNWG